MEQPIVQKVYESMPAYEQIKQYVVQKIIELSEQATQLQTLLYMRKRNKMLASQFKSEVLNFYEFIRPKIINHIAAKKDSKYSSLVKILDYFMEHPLKFTLADAIKTFINLNQFCEDYKLTSTAVWAGTASTFGDLMNA